MPHLVLAAQTLIRQINERKGRVEFKTGEPDGLNRVRSVEFDTKTSEWLQPILEACDDPRVSDLTTKKKRLTVTFVASVKADDRTQFALDEADEVLND